MVKRFGLLWKCLLLALLDIGTVLLFFAIWDIIQLKIFPFVLLNLLLVLLAVDIAVIAFPHARRRQPEASWMPFSVLTALYYIFTFLFSGLTCTWMDPAGYAAWGFFLFAAYIAGTLAVVFPRKRKAGHPEGRELVDLQQLQLQMAELEKFIRVSQEMLEPRQYDSLCRAYASLREKLAYSTPFGRSPKPVVMDMEKRIADRITNCLSKMQEICPQNASETVKRVTISFLDISELIKNKEKLLAG